MERAGLGRHADRPQHGKGQEQDHQAPRQAPRGQQDGAGEAGDVQPEAEGETQRQGDVQEQVQEEEDALDRPLADEGPADGLGQNRQGVDDAGAFNGELGAELVPHHHQTGHAADHEQREEDQAGDPGQEPRSPAAFLGDHPQGVQGHRHDRRIRGIPMDAAHPVAGPPVGGEAGDGVPGGADAVEEQQPEAGGEQHQEEAHHDGAALVERVVAPAVEPVEGRVGGAEPPAERPFEGLNDGVHRARTLPASRVEACAVQNII
jgi:hypothetical protein